MAHRPHVEESSGRADAGAGNAAASGPACVVDGGSMSGSERDSMHMRRALELARKGVGSTRPNPAVGCVILDKEGVVVGEGFHPRAGEPHAEVWAIREAGDRARGGTAYVTLEPCNHFGRTPPCTGALIKNGLSSTNGHEVINDGVAVDGPFLPQVVAGMVDPDPRTAGSGLRRLAADAGMDVSVGVEGEACKAINAPFVHRILKKSCYGVLHCALDSSPAGSAPSLGDTQGEGSLILPVQGDNYMEYDAIVVEGGAGVRKLEACMAGLRPTVWRVVLITSMSDDGVEEELRAVLDSAVFKDPASHTVVVSAVPRVEFGDKAESPGSARSLLASRGVQFVDVPPVRDSEQPGASGQEERSRNTGKEAAVAAIASALHDRGLLCCAWDVGPEVAASSLRGGHIQRALVRRVLPGDGARRPGSLRHDRRRCELGEGRGDDDDEVGGEMEMAWGERSQEEDMVVRALSLISRNERVCVRAPHGPRLRESSVEKGFVEILIPDDSPGLSS